MGRQHWINLSSTVGERGGSPSAHLRVFMREGVSFDSTGSGRIRVQLISHEKRDMRNKEKEECAAFPPPFYLPTSM